MFSEVVTGSEGESRDEETSCGEFSVRCLGALPLQEKVTSLEGLQEPLRKLHSGVGRSKGKLDVCAAGLRVQILGQEQVRNVNENFSFRGRFCRRIDQCYLGVIAVEYQEPKLTYIA